MGYDIMVDYWSFGIILYELIYNHTPFVDLDKQILYKNILYNVIKYF